MTVTVDLALPGTVLAIAHAGALFFLLSLVLPQWALYDAFFVARPSVHVGLVLFTFLLAPVELVLSLALHAWSRRNERQADAFEDPSQDEDGIGNDHQPARAEASGDLAELVASITAEQQRAGGVERPGVAHRK